MVCFRHLSSIAFFVSLFLYGTSSSAQSLRINGVTDPLHGASVEVPLGGTLEIVIRDAPSRVGAPYALAIAFEVNSRSSGWWLETEASGVTAPTTLVTGIPTKRLEQTFHFENGDPVDIHPDQFGSHEFRLGATTGGAEASFSFPIPFEPIYANLRFYVQAVVQPPRGNPDLQLTNGIEVRFVNPLPEARLQLARGEEVNELEFGDLSFVSDPSRAEFVPSPELGGQVDVVPLQLPGMAFLSSGVELGAGSQIDSVSHRSVSRANDSLNLSHIAIPETSTGIPARDLYLVRDRVKDQYGWIVVNHGENPNQLGKRVFSPANSFKADPLSPTTNPWSSRVLISPDRTHALVALELSQQSPQVFLMAIDGRSPYPGERVSSAKPSALRRITPNISLDSVDIGSSFFGNRGVVFAYADGWQSSNREKRLWFAPYPSEGPTEEIPIEGLPNDSRPIRNFPDNNVVWNREANVMVFTAGVTSSHRDLFAIDLSARPLVARNVSAFSQPTDVEAAGDTYDGRDGYTALSPSGEKVAFVANLDERRVFWVSTNGQDAGAPRLLTDLSTYPGPFGSPIDLYWADDDNLLFWYGTFGTSGDRGRDLFRYTVSSNRHENLTRTPFNGIQERFPPFTQSGTIQGRGFFVDHEQDLYVFLRDNAADRLGTRRACNLVSVNLNSYAVRDLTGSEFSGGFGPEIKGPSPIPEGDRFVVRRSPGPNSYYWFSSSLITPSSAFNAQLFVFDAAAPFVAVPVTDFEEKPADTRLRNITPAAYGPSAGFSLERNPTDSDILFVDASSRVLRELVTGVSPTGQSFWVIEGSTLSHPALVYSYGISPRDTPNFGTQIDYVELLPNGQWVPQRIGTVGGNEFLGILSATRN